MLLQDGRKLGYATYGNPNGFPIIYCHGSQRSRLEMHYDMAFANDNDLNIITVDRPGHGLSDYNAKGTILSFATDVKQLAAHLNITQFSVAGMSAGAPFALGIAYLFPKYVVKATIISGFAPFTDKSKTYLKKEVKTMLNLAKSAPFLLRLMLKIQAKRLKKRPKKALNGFLKIMSEPDQDILKNDAVLRIIENMFVEAFRNGSKGVAHEISKILVNDWNFPLHEIKVPVAFWQGENDHNVPPEWATLMQQEIKQASLKSYPNEGHLLIFKYATELFTQLKPV